MKRLRELRKARHISQVKLAMDMNLSQRAISKYENGIHEPSLTMLKKMAQYFNTSVDYMIGYTDIAAPIDRIAQENMTEQEALLLNNFRQLTRENKTKAEGVLLALLTDEKGN